MSQQLNAVIVGKAEAKEVKYFEVDGIKMTFTDAMLKDPRPITLTYQGLFDLVSKSSQEVQEMN